LLINWELTVNYVLEIQEAFTNSKAAEEKTGKGTYKQLTKTILVARTCDSFQSAQILGIKA
jgi:methyl coenzyme M reductase alpha subunit